MRAIERPSAFTSPPVTQGELSVLEQAHAAYDLYLWFSLRCPSAFPEHDYAQALRKQCAAAIELGLQRSASAKLRRSGKRLAGYVDETKLARAAAETERLEAELEMAGFGAADDIDGVYGTVTFTPGGGLARAKLRKRAREAEKRFREGPIARRARRKKNQSRANEKEGERAPRGTAADRSFAERNGFELHWRRSACGRHRSRRRVRVAEARVAPSGGGGRRGARAASARAARGYAADFAAPLLSRRAARETKRRDALLGSIARLAGIRTSYGNEGEDE